MKVKTLRKLLEGMNGDLYIDVQAYSACAAERAGTVLSTAEPGTVVIASKPYLRRARDLRVAKEQEWHLS